MPHLRGDVSPTIPSGTPSAWRVVFFVRRSVFSLRRPCPPLWNDLFCRRARAGSTRPGVSSPRATRALNPLDAHTTVEIVRALGIPTQVVTVQRRFWRTGTRSHHAGTEVPKHPDPPVWKVKLEKKPSGLWWSIRPPTGKPLLAVRAGMCFFRSGARPRRTGEDLEPGAGLAPCPARARHRWYQYGLEVMPAPPPPTQPAGIPVTAKGFLRLAGGLRTLAGIRFASTARTETPSSPCSTSYAQDLELLTGDPSVGRRRVLGCSGWAAIRAQAFSASASGWIGRCARVSQLAATFCLVPRPGIFRDIQLRTRSSSQGPGATPTRVCL